MFTGICRVSANEHKQLLAFKLRRTHGLGLARQGEDFVLVFNAAPDLAAPWPIGITIFHRGK